MKTNRADNIGIFIRTLISAGFHIDNVHYQNNYIQIECHRFDEFGIGIPYFIVFVKDHINLAVKKALDKICKSKGSSLIIIGDKSENYRSISINVFLKKLGGPIISWLPYNDHF